RLAPAKIPDWRRSKGNTQIRPHAGLQHLSVELAAFDLDDARCAGRRLLGHRLLRCRECHDRACREKNRAAESHISPSQNYWPRQLASCNCLFEGHREVKL